MLDSVYDEYEERGDEWDSIPTIEEDVFGCGGCVGASIALETILSFLPEKQRPQLLEKLAKSDVHFSVKVAVAMYKELPLKVAKILAKSKDVGVVNALAANHFTPPAVLAKLATHEEEAVREAVACNPNTPTVALRALLHDEDDSVASTAEEALEERAEE